MPSVRTLALALVAVLALAAAPSALALSPNVVVSQVYGGGGNTGATLKNDYIELYNRGLTAIEVTGWSVQYASTTGTTWQRTTLSGTIEPGHYYLVKEAQGAGGTVDLPNADAIGTIAMSATAGKVVLAATTTTIAGGTSCPSDATVVDVVGYGSGTNCFEGTGPTPTLSNTTAAFRLANGCAETDDNGADFAAGPPSPRNSLSPASFCSEDNVQIHDIQGAAQLSPLSGQSVSDVAGIVTARRSSGFYMQDPTPDADDATSEGIFVFTASAPTVAVGDAVEVDGRVMEFRPGGSTSTNLTTTEITSPSVIVTSSGTPLPSPTVVGNGGRIPPDTVIEDDASGSVETSGVFDSAADGIDFYESLEGMRVQLNDALAVGPTNEFGEIPVVGDGGANAGIRTARGGVVIRPADFNPERITLDDSILGTPTLDVGDRLGGAVVGVMDYSFGNFKLNITEPPTAVRGGLAREISAGAGPKEIAVATFNVENLDPSDGPAKFDRLADLIVTNLKSPDLLALEEVQDNNGPVNDTTTDADLTLAMLVGAIQSAGGPTYEWRQINPVDDQDGGEPGGNIRVAFLFRSDRGVEFRDRPGGDSTTATQVASTPSGPELTFSPGRIDPTNPAWNGSRKPLAAEFKIRNRKFFVIANHFNSKGGDQPLFGRFQPPTRSSEVQRHQQAQVVNDFVDQILAVDPNANVVALGDFNDFEFSSALRTLEGDVLNDLIETLPQEERYSFVFEGNSQTLDHILASDHLRDDVPFAFDVVHVNSEFADQASDHDPSVVRFALNNPPRPHAAGPYTVGEGGAVTVAASADDPEGDPVTYAWDLDGDGTFETPGQAATFSAAGLDGPTSRAIAVRATDDGGLSGVDSVAVAITNVGPTVRSAFTPFAVACGTDNGALEASVADPGPDTFSASVDWGDGSPAEALGAVGSSFAPLHTYAAAGLYEATLTVTDDDGGTGSFAASVRVNYAVTVLRPLGDRSRDILQAASTIPVKIAVADCDGSRPANLRPRIRVVKTSGSPPNLEINEPLSTSAADTTGIMRFEGSQYVYNLAGKALPDPTATYRIAMTLPNGQVVTASFGLRT